jgi:hypothetical protein
MHNKNSIMSLVDQNGEVKFKHDEKAAIIWESFKDRLGSSEFSHMYFNLVELIQEEGNLSDLDKPFSKHEINSTIADLPLGKSPEPDGFNSDFIKKCWETIS